MMLEIMSRISRKTGTENEGTGIEETGTIIDGTGTVGVNGTGTIIGGTGTRTAVEIVTVNRDLKIKIGQIAGVAEVQNILTKRNKTTMKAEVSVVKIKNS